MAASKRPTSANDTQAWNFVADSNSNPRTSSYSSRSPPANSNFRLRVFLLTLRTDSSSRALTTKTRSFGGLDDYDEIFGGPVKPTKQSEGSSFNFDSIFSGSNAKSSSFNGYKDVYDVFGGMPGLKRPGSGLQKWIGKGREILFLVEGFDDKGALLEKKESLVIKEKLMELVSESKRRRREGKNARINNTEIGDDIDEFEYDDGFQSLFESEDLYLDDDGDEKVETVDYRENGQFWTVDAHSVLGAWKQPMEP
ncbi:hypothetical protein L3X38_026760 [Prunus dulcis]|uniref:Uncharacterized protein n=1 Tax=Prunus dulcis TaxID=3755 RepID=A0AAD4VN51_PRUDU|nr:hypothetical protein L3X38_026760 [Prunus dulcis]